jgi:hypothetical protein
MEKTNWYLRTTLPPQAEDPYLKTHQLTINVRTRKLKKHEHHSKLADDHAQSRGLPCARSIGTNRSLGSFRVCVCVCVCACVCVGVISSVEPVAFVKTSAVCLEISLFFISLYQRVSVAPCIDTITSKI